MLRSIFGTIGTRLAVMLMTVGVVLLNTQMIGAEGQGTVALISLGILLIFSLNNFVGGGIIVYLIPRVPRGALFLPSAIWSLISTGVFWLIFDSFDIVPREFIIDILILGFLQNLFGYQQQVLLGRKRIRHFNSLILLQWALVVSSLAIMYLFAEWIDVSSYIKSLYISFIAVFLVGLAMTHTEVSFTLKNAKNTIRQVVKLGFFTQTSNVLQLLINRFTFIILDQLQSRSGVGIFSVGMQMNEAVLAPSKSTATVQYADLSNSTDRIRNVRLSIDLLKISVIVTILISTVVVLLPEEFYLWLFGDELDGIGQVLLFLWPGMIFMAFTSILAHHFSGTGRPQHNMIASIVAFALVVGLGYKFIPDHGIVGAAWVTSSAFCGQMLYLLVAFIAVERPVAKWFFTKVDLKSLK